jgi:hypothetical protein
MKPLWIAIVCTALSTGCSLASSAEAAPAPAAAQMSREEIVNKTHAMIDSISARLSERDLAASVASEHVALLNQRAGKLRARCDRMTGRERAQFQPHLDWLDQVHHTTTLSIGVLRNDSRDFEEDKAEVLLWTKVFMKEIDSLERRVDRVAPVNVLLSQRSRK